ncbi:MAG: tetratricopeptide repeat protein [Candidatus Heimdallarchaeota archaeon]|nr:tetratricopeptide repeat protein [Candidatus Heimdallarchaeota archaeon]
MEVLENLFDKLYQFPTEDEGKNYEDLMMSIKFKDEADTNKLQYIESVILTLDNKFNEAIDLVTEILERKDLNLIYQRIFKSFLVRIYLEIGKYKEAEIYYQQVINLDERSVDFTDFICKLELIQFQKSSGNLNLIKEEFDDAIKSYNRALSLLGDEKNKNNVFLNIRSSIYGNIALYYDYNGDIDIALTYHFKSLDISKQQNNFRKSANDLNNIGVIYFLQGKLNLSLSYHNQSLNIHQKKKHIHQIAAPLSNIGTIYRLVGDLKLALEFQQSALRYSLDVENYTEASNIQIELGKIFRAKMEYKESINHFDKALDYLNKELSGELKLRIIIFEKLITILEMNDEDLITETMILLDPSDSKSKNIWIISKLGQALVNKQKNSFDSLSKAQSILENIIEDKLFNFEYYILALTHLIDLELYEMEMLKLYNFTDKLTSNIELLKKLSKDSNSKILEIWCKIFDIRKDLIKGDVISALNSLNYSLSLAESYNITDVIDKLSGLNDLIISRVIQTKLTSTENNMNVEPIGELRLKLDGNIQSTKFETDIEIPHHFVILDQHYQIITNIYLHNAEEYFKDLEKVLSDFQKIRSMMPELDKLGKIILNELNISYSFVKSFIVLYIYTGNPLAGKIRFEMLFNLVKSIIIKHSNDTRINPNSIKNLINRLVSNVIQPVDKEIVVDLIDFKDINLKENLKIIFDPIRLAILKHLTIFNRFIASEFRTMLKVNWSTFNWHIKILSDNKLVEETKEIVGTKVVRIIHFTFHGVNQYKKVKYFMDNL